VSRWLALAGYMGAGKSTVGREVAGRLGRAFVDSDDAIEEAAGIGIPEIFSTKGELWFRRTEERVIRDILADRPGVLALGGGAAESAKTRDLLSRSAQVAYLELPVGVAWERIAGSDRPLAQDQRRFERRAVAREPNYRAAADLVLDAARPVPQVVDELTAWVEAGTEA